MIIAKYLPLVAIQLLASLEALIGVHRLNFLIKPS